MEIIPYESGPLDTNCYLVIDNSTAGEISTDTPAFIVDAPPDAVSHMLPVIEERKLIIKMIVLTHTHWDHTLDTAELKRMTGAPVFVHKEDEYRLLNPNESTIFKLPFTVEPVKPDGYLVHGMKLKCGTLEYEVLHTPGHTEGSICLFDRINKVIFTGDTLFNGSVGRTDFPGGSWDQLSTSIEKHLLTLPDEIVVYSGHGVPTTIGDEKIYNQFIGQIHSGKDVFAVGDNYN